MSIYTIKKYKTIKDENGNEIQVPKSKEQWNKETRGGKYIYGFIDWYIINNEKKQYKSRVFELKREAEAEERLFLDNPIKYIMEHSKRAKKNPEILKIKESEKSDNKTLNDYFFDFLNYEIHCVKEGTVYEYKGCWDNHISEIIGDKTPSMLDLPTIKALKNLLSKKINPKTKKLYSIETKNKWIYCLSAFFRYLFEDGLIELNYLKVVGGFKSLNENINEEKKIKYQTEEQFNLFMSIVDDITWYCFFNFLFWHGLRIGEQRALKIKNVNLKEKYIIIKDNIAKNKNGKEHTTSIKNRRKRKIYLADQSYKYVEKLINLYKQMEGYNDEWYLFGGSQKLSKNSIQRKLKTYYLVLKKKYSKIEINQLTHHEFGRHSHASYLLNLGIEQGMSIDEILILIAQRLGDTVEVIRETYAHQYEDVNDAKIINLLKIKKGNIT